MPPRLTPTASSRRCRTRRARGPGHVVQDLRDPAPRDSVWNVNSTPMLMIPNATIARPIFAREHESVARRGEPAHQAIAQRDDRKADQRRPGASAATAAAGRAEANATPSGRSRCPRRSAAACAVGSGTSSDVGPPGIIGVQAASGGPAPAGAVGRRRIGRVGAAKDAAMQGATGARTGGQILVANLLAQGATHAFGVPGESYLAVLDALHDVRDRLPLHRLPAGRRRRLHGRSVRQADRPARHRLRHARTRRVERRDRHPHGRAGFDADDRVRRPGRHRFRSIARRSRRSTTGACTAASPNGRRRSTAPSAFPNTLRTRTALAMSGPAGPGRARVARRHADVERRRAPTRRASRPVAAAPAAADVEAAQALLRDARTPLVLVGGSRWTMRHACAPARLRRGDRTAGRLRVSPPGPVRQPPSELRRRRRHRHQPEARARACAMPTCCSSSASGWAR